MTISASGATAVPLTVAQRSARVMVIVQSAVGISYFAGAGGLLLTAAIRGDKPDPMLLLPDLGGIELLLYLPIFLAVTLWLPLGLICVLGGAALLVLNRASWNDQVRLMWTLASTTTIALAYLIISMSAFGVSTQEWFLT